jgi:hypothetical protein
MFDLESESSKSSVSSPGMPKTNSTCSFSSAATNRSEALMVKTFWQALVAIVSCTSGNLANLCRHCRPQDVGWESRVSSGSSIDKCHPERALATEGSGLQYHHALKTSKDESRFFSHRPTLRVGARSFRMTSRRLLRSINPRVIIVVLSPCSPLLHEG